MALNITPPETQMTDVDLLRLNMNLNGFKTGLRHVIGSSVMALATASGAVGLTWVAASQQSFIALLFAGMMAATTFWFVTYCRSAGGVLLEDYYKAISRADEANREIQRLRMRVFRLSAERSRREEGEAGEGVGYDDTSPASEVLFINPKRVN